MCGNVHFTWNALLWTSSNHSALKFVHKFTVSHETNSYCEFQYETRRTSGITIMILTMHASNTINHINVKHKLIFMYLSYLAMYDTMSAS